MPTPGRRPLDFATLDQVMPDVDLLLAGHRTVGAWSLGQICNHLATAIRLSAEGGPLKSKGMWLIRKTIGPFLKRKFFQARRIPEGIRVPTPSLTPRPALDDRAEAESLRATIRLFAPESGPPVEHPLMGKFSPEEWRTFHAIHCAHHLSFAIPKSS